MRRTRQQTALEDGIYLPKPKRFAKRTTPFEAIVNAKVEWNFRVMKLTSDSEDDDRPLVQIVQPMAGKRKNPKPPRKIATTKAAKKKMKKIPVRKVIQKGRKVASKKKSLIGTRKPKTLCNLKRQELAELEVAPGTDYGKNQNQEEREVEKLGINTEVGKT